MKIAFRRRDTAFTKTLSKRLADALAHHTFLDWPADAAAPAGDIEILLAASADRALLESQPKLAFVQTTSAGHEGLDLDAASELGIWVAFAPSGETGNAVSVAEFAVFLLIAALRRAGVALAAVRDRDVNRDVIPQSLYGRSACIVGLGTIGHELAARLKPFGVRLSAVDAHDDRATGIPTLPPERLRDAVADVDCIVICAPGGPDTTHLFDARTIAAMKRGAVLVNIARGTLVDEQALANALESGQIGAAGLDVVEHEPVDPANPLLRFPQVVVTPHVAGQTELMIAGTARYVTAAVEAFAAGKKPEALLDAPRSPRKALN